MSLLDSGTEDIIVFLEEVVTDEDGNLRTQPSKCGVPAKATIQPLGQSGTAARRSEQDNEGFESEKVYWMRLPRSFPYVIKAQSRIEWRITSYSNFIIILILVLPRTLASSNHYEEWQMYQKLQ